MEKEYFPIPDEVVDLIEEYEANISCRDSCIKRIFKANRAVKYAKAANKARRLFWKKVIEIYPDLSENKLSYDWNKKAVYVSDT